MSADELKSMRPGSFIVMKTGAHPFISKLKLFTKWGIEFNMGKCELEDKDARPVHYAGKDTILQALDRKYPQRVAVFESISEEVVPYDIPPASAKARLHQAVQEKSQVGRKVDGFRRAGGVMPPPDRYRPDNLQARRQARERRKRDPTSQMEDSSESEKT